VSEKNSIKAKKSVALRWRKSKKLCLRCGTEIHEGDCIENYEKVDLRNIDNSNIQSETDFNKRKKTILNYRRKKDLCLRCGKDKHEDQCDEIILIQIIEQ
jgi:ribosomal protein S27AE